MKKGTVIALTSLFMTAAFVSGCGKKTQEEAETMQPQTIAQSETTKQTEALESETETLKKTQSLDEPETDEPQIGETELQAVMYALDDVYVRAKKDADSEIVGIAERGNELTVTEQDGDWCRVSLEGADGYVMAKFLTESQEEAQNAVAAQEAAAEQAAREAAQNSQSQSSGRQEVSRQNFDDCDGSGHGYTIITYSDGSTETVEY